MLAWLGVASIGRGENLLWHGIAGAERIASGRGGGNDQEPGAQPTGHVDGLGRDDAGGGVTDGVGPARMEKNCPTVMEPTDPAFEASFGFSDLQTDGR